LTECVNIFTSITQVVDIEGLFLTVIVLYQFLGEWYKHKKVY